LEKSMQKKLIALAIAGLASTGALAQTNVTIWGVADVGYFNIQSDQAVSAANPTGKDNKFSGIGNAGLSGNRLGFRASEDLGGGLTAGVWWEFGSVSTDGGAQAGAASVSGLASTRQAYVHLTSKDYGAFQAGRIYTAGTNAAGKFDPEGAAAFGPVSRITTGLALSIDGGGNNNARVNNSIAWLSPNWKGFTAQVQYAFGENGEQTKAAAAVAAANVPPAAPVAAVAAVPGGNSDDARMWGLGVDYTNGPWAVGFAYNDWSDYGGTTSGTASRDMTEWFIGGSYDFGMLKLTGSYQDFDMDNMTTAAAQGATTGAATRGASSQGDIWSLGVVVPVMKAGTVTVSYASLDRSTRTAAGAARMGADADGWGISYKHAMSKRTTAYVGYTQLDNSNKANPLSTLGVGTVATPTAGKDSSGWGMGMRHTF
jgi:predicted porin